MSSSDRQQIQRLTAALMAAEDEDGVDDGLWLAADRILTEIGGTYYPQLLLPQEFTDRIVGMKLEPLPTDLWRIVAGYAASNDDAVSCRVDRLVFARVVCLAMTAGRTDDAMELSATIRPTDVDRRIETAEAYSLLATRLFVVQAYAAAARVYSEVLRIMTGLPSSKGFRWHTERALAFCFLGLFTVARYELQTAETLGIPTDDAWSNFTKAMVRFPDDRSAAVRAWRSTQTNLRSAFNAGYDNGSCYGVLLLALLDELLSDADPVSAASIPEWLRARHAAALKRLDPDQLHRLRFRCPRFLAEDVGPSL